MRPLRRADNKDQETGQDSFFSERRMDDRFDTKRNSFVSRMTARKGISGEKAMRLFDSDNYDSDGDGISNLMERAFGGDSLTNDSKSIMPRAIRKKDGYEYIVFSRFSDAYNSGDDKIEYIVETSRDLRTCLTPPAPKEPNSWALPKIWAEGWNGWFSEARRPVRPTETPGSSFGSGSKPDNSKITICGAWSCGPP